MLLQFSVPNLYFLNKVLIKAITNIGTHIKQIPHNTRIPKVKPESASNPIPMEADKILKHKAAMLNIIFPLLVFINISPPFKLSDKLLMKQKLVSFSFSVSVSVQF